MIGKSLRHFKITAKLGEGGMGTVYRAEDRKLGREVAIKVLPEEFTSDPDRLRRFEREARALAAIDHPNIVTVFSVEEENGVHFLTMALIEGRTLDELIPKRGFTLERLLEMAETLADALRAAHEHGVVHRDLKPANVMVDGDGRLRILDFGLARLQAESYPVSVPSHLPTEPMTREGAVLGTYPYMSPEQVEGQPADARSDIFSIGVLLHQMATGERPFRGETPASLTAAILTEIPPAVDEVRGDLPHHLGRILRRCLEKDPERRYQRAGDLLYELRELRRETAAESRAESAPGPGPERPTKMRRRLSRTLAAVVVVALIAMGVGYLMMRWSQVPSEIGRRDIRSIAVVPLTNLMNDPEQQYFVDGMTEALIADLAKIGDLAVISRTSVMRYRETEKSAPEIARELDVDALLEGSVLRAGDQVRITAQLIDGRSDTHLWVETYDRALTDILSLHSEVARAVAAEIRVQLTTSEAERLAEGEPVHPEAYEAYLKGKFHLERYTRQDLELAREFLDRALELDPDLVEAHVALGRYFDNLAALGFAPPIEAIPLARQSLLRALELDPESAEAHAGLGFQHLTYDLDFEACRREAEIALELEPNNSNAHWTYGGYFLVTGQLEPGFREIRTVTRLDPLAVNYRVGEAWMLVQEGRTEEALAKVDRALELNPQFGWGQTLRSEILFRLGREEEGVEQVRASYSPPVADAFIEGYREGGLERGFGEVARELETILEAGSWVPPFALASTWARAGETDRALEWVERMVEVRSSMLWQLKIDLTLTLESLQPEARFNELTAQIGLPE